MYLLCPRAWIASPLGPGFSRSRGKERRVGPFQIVDRKSHLIRKGRSILSRHSRAVLHWLGPQRKGRQKDYVDRRDGWMAFGSKEGLFNAAKAALVPPVKPARLAKGAHLRAIGESEPRRLGVRTQRGQSWLPG